MSFWKTSIFAKRNGSADSAQVLASKQQNAVQWGNRLIPDAANMALTGQFCYFPPTAALLAELGKSQPPGTYWACNKYVPITSAVSKLVAAALPPQGSYTNYEEGFKRPIPIPKSPLPTTLDSSSSPQQLLASKAASSPWAVLGFSALMLSGIIVIGGLSVYQTVNTPWQTHLANRVFGYGRSKTKLPLWMRS